MRMPVVVLAMGLMAAWSGVTAMGVARAVGSVLPGAMAQVDAVMAQVDLRLAR